MTYEEPERRLCKLNFVSYVPESRSFDCSFVCFQYTQSVAKMCAFLYS